MTTTASEIEVGAHVNSLEEMRRFPVGTVVRNEIGDTYNLTWQSSNMMLVPTPGVTGGAMRITDVRYDDWWTLLSSPQPADGTPITSVDQWVTLPVGTRLRLADSDGSDRWVVGMSDSGHRTLAARNTGPINADLCCTTGTRADGGLVVHNPNSEPEPYTYTPMFAEVDVFEHSEAAPAPRIETLDEFKQRLASVTVGQARSSGVSLTPVLQALRSLGVDPQPETVMPGMTIAMGDNHLVPLLPTDSVVVDSTGSVFTKTIGGSLAWAHIGPNQHLSTPMRIVHIPGMEYVEQSGSDDDRHEVHRFKRDVWRIGSQAKADNSWCGDFERAMGVLGITGDEQPLDAWLTSEEVRALPEGTILEWRSDHERLLMVRDNRSTNEARTLRIAGPRYGWTPVGNVVLYQPGSDMNIRPASTTELEQVPVGTIIGHRRGVRTGEQFTKQANGRWTYGNGGDYNSRDFTAQAMYYNRIGN